MALRHYDISAWNVVQTWTRFAQLYYSCNWDAIVGDAFTQTRMRRGALLVSTMRTLIIANLMQQIASQRNETYTAFVVARTVCIKRSPLIPQIFVHIYIYAKLTEIYNECFRNCCQHQHSRLKRPQMHTPTCSMASCLHGIYINVH